MTLVSVLIASHRGGRMLTRAIESLEQQTFEGSGGPASGVQLLVDYEYAEPLGDRLNRLESIARGEWLLVLSDDDYLEPRFLERMLWHPIADVSDVLYSNALVVVNGTRTFASMRPWTLEEFRKGPPCWLTSLVRREMWQRVGGHDGAFAFHDWDFWYRCFKAGARGAHIPEWLWFYSEHPGQWSHQVDRVAARAEMVARHPELA